MSFALLSSPHDPIIASPASARFLCSTLLRPRGACWSQNRRACGEQKAGFRRHQIEHKITGRERLQSRRGSPGCFRWEECHTVQPVHSPPHNQSSRAASSIWPKKRRPDAAAGRGIPGAQRRRISSSVKKAPRCGGVEDLLKPMSKGVTLCPEPWDCREIA
jgi:hypothetical protein